jgi:triphosphatase
VGDNFCPNKATSDMTEFELKFEIPSANLLRAAAALKEGKTSRQRLQARYFDTAQGALAARGLVVRMRKEGRRWVQTAKGPTSTLLERLEHNVTLAQQTAGTAPEVDLARHDATPVGEAIAKALNLKAGEEFPPLTPLYEVDVQRSTRLVEHAGSVIEIALDQGRIQSGAQTLELCELEVELKNGQAEHAAALARQWCADYGLSLSSISKSMKGQQLRNTEAARPAVYASAPEFQRDSTGAHIVAVVLQSCLNHILPNASEIAAGGTDPDHVHQLRVGLRRLRTALRELEGLTDAFDPAWEAALVQVFRQLGEYRDHDHLEKHLQPALLAAGGPRLNIGQMDTGVPSPGAAVRAPAFQDALLGLIGFAHRSEPQTEGHPVPDSDAVKKILRKRLQKLRVQALREGENFTQLTEVDQHRVRKRLKRLRYLSEFSAPFFKASKVSAFISALKPAQDALGLYNDELMALQAYRRLAAEDPRAWFGVGWLEARRVPNAQRCLKEVDAFAKAQPFWH